MKREVVEYVNRCSCAERWRPNISAL